MNIAEKIARQRAVEHTWGIIISLGIMAAGAAGYIMNILNVFSNFDVMTGGEAVVRVAGIIIPLLGAIVGYF